MQHMEMAAQASGTLLGHVAGGTAFFAWGVLWLVQNAREGGARAAGAAVESGIGAPIGKIVFVALMVWGEWPNSGWRPHDFVMAVHHMTAYSGVGLTGVVDLLARSGRVSSRATYVAFAAAMFNLAFLFAVHGNPAGAEAAGHLVLEVTWLALGLFALLEILLPSSGIHWFRIGAMIASGTWVLTLSWILYLSGWNLADPLTVSWTYLAFSWNAMAVASLVVAVRVVAGPREPATAR